MARVFGVFFCFIANSSGLRIALDLLWRSKPLPTVGIGKENCVEKGLLVERVSQNHRRNGLTFMD